VKPTILLHLVPRQRMSGDMRLFTLMPLWHETGAFLYLDLYACVMPYA
jgi:hypothetical protein